MTGKAAPAADWFILADDLTGACDCAVAFAAAGRCSAVVWGSRLPTRGTIARDTDSRRLNAMAATEAVTLALESAGAGRRLYKKIDSTLRGQPAAEIAAVIRHRRKAGKGALVLLAPAFPATGRTMLQGRVLLHGKPLEESALWARDHSYPTADLAAALRREGLRVRPLGLAALRGEPGTLQARMRDAQAEGADILLCDAETAADLARLAAAGLPLGEGLVWAGSGGLAGALAQATAGQNWPAPAPTRPPGGTLFVVGSIAEASRAAAAVLAADRGVRHVPVAPGLLRGAGSMDVEARIVAPLRAGSDVLVTIAEEPAPDLAEGAAIAVALAWLLAPAATACGALFATGGETARALLQAFGVTAIQLGGEIEPGVPWGLTEGAVQCPIVTKAGGFGDAATLRRCLSHLRDLRPQENDP